MSVDKAIESAGVALAERWEPPPRVTVWLPEDDDATYDALAFWAARGYFVVGPQ